jgi:hypothetical protein
MNDRLRRRLTPVVIDRIRRSTHDRADANRTLLEAVRPLSAAEQLAARVEGRPMPMSAQLEEPRDHVTVPRQCYCGRPRTSRRLGVSRDAGCTRSITTSSKRKLFGAVTSIRSHKYCGDTRARAIDSGFPDASLLLPASARRVHPVCMAQETCSLHAGSATKLAGRGRSELESHVSSAGRAVYHQYAHGWVVFFLRARGSLVPLSPLVRVARLAPIRSRGLRGGMRKIAETYIAAQTRMRCKMHSRAEIRPERCGINRAAPSRSRRNGVR